MAHPAPARMGRDEAPSDADLADAGARLVGMIKALMPAERQNEAMGLVSLLVGAQVTGVVTGTGEGAAVAMDAAGEDALYKRFPGLERLGKAW